MTYEQISEQTSLRFVEYLGIDLDNELWDVLTLEEREGFIEMDFPTDTYDLLLEIVD